MVVFQNLEVLKCAVCCCLGGLCSTILSAANLLSSLSNHPVFSSVISCFFFVFFYPLPYLTSFSRPSSSDFGLRLQPGGEPELQPQDFMFGHRQPSAQPRQHRAAKVWQHRVQGKRTGSCSTGRRKRLLLVNSKSSLENYTRAGCDARPHSLEGCK